MPSLSKLPYHPFSRSLNKYRCLHAVALCGRTLFHLIMRTLICGDIENISGCVREKLGSNTQYKNSFTNDELHLLEIGDHRTWDISLLFKILQKVCGLQPADNTCWTQPNGGDEPIEYYITTLKNLRNEQCHKFHLGFTEDQMEECLIELENIARKIISALGVRAQEQGKYLSKKESGETDKEVIQIIADVKVKINESAPTAFSPPGTVSESVEYESGSNEEDKYNDYESNNLQFDSV